MARYKSKWNSSAINSNPERYNPPIEIITASASKKNLITKARKFKNTKKMFIICLCTFAASILVLDKFNDTYGFDI